MKNHEWVDGRLLQTNKKYSHLNTAVLRTHLQVEVHHNRFIVKARCEAFHFATGIIDPASHARVVIICRLHVVLCAIGRDQKDGSPASVECFTEFPDIIFCSVSHGLYLLLDFLSGLFVPIRFSLDLYISYHPEAL